MTDSSSARKARFNVGDRVRVVGPSIRDEHHNTGEVTEIVGRGTSGIFRYRVTFQDGTSELFFGFELELENR
jgi:hypothetical protein